ncbi:MAG: hypothetical protein OXH50_19465 [Gemmatimonadetes bacterium]|nr:hypothetical protein [Gemmatimonadota bacterium]
MKPARATGRLAAAAFLLSWTAGAGASGLPFLLLGSGARATALGEAAAALADVDAAAANPAAVSVAGGRLGVTHSSWIQDVRHEYATALQPLGAGILSAQLSLSRSAGLERRVGPSLEPLGEFGVYEWFLGLGYGRRSTANLQFGAAWKVVRQSIHTESAMGAALDFGFLYRLGDRLRAGGSVRNLGVMNPLAEDSTELPGQARLAFACSCLGKPFGPQASRLALIEVQLARGYGSSFHGGTEWPLSATLVLRWGYQTGSRRSLSAGFGLQVRSWRIDYAYVPFASGLGQAHRLSLYRGRAPASSSAARML